MADLFNMDDSMGMGFLDKKSNSNDGIYRPNLKNAKDKKKGYRAVLRFLPNFTTDGKLGEFTITKLVHYANFTDYTDLNGYYDSMKSFGKGEKCDLYDTFWQLKNSKSVVQQERAKQIAYSTKYYSYVQVIEDENQPEMEGKIMIFPFGKKIKEKIAAEYSGEITGEKCNVYDIANGKDFVLIIREVGGFANYDSSTFKPEVSAIKISGKEVPVVEDSNGKRSINAKFQGHVKEYLLKRDKNLEDFAPQKWNEQQRGKVQRIVEILTGNPVSQANASISSASKTDFYNEPEVLSTSSSTSTDDVDPDDFFDNI